MKRLILLFVFLLLVSVASAVELYEVTLSGDEEALRAEIRLFNNQESNSTNLVVSVELLEGLEIVDSVQSEHFDVERNGKGRLQLNLTPTAAFDTVSISLLLEAETLDQLTFEIDDRSRINHTLPKSTLQNKSNQVLQDIAYNNSDYVATALCNLGTCNNINDCPPQPCPSGYTDYGYNCNGVSCTRICQVLTCSDSRSLIFESSNTPDWNDNDYDEEDRGAGFTPPNPNSCYAFEFTGSYETDNDDSECYDLYSGDDYDPGDFDEDCDGNDVDGYAGMGFVGNRLSSTWMSTIGYRSSEAYGYTGSTSNPYWDYRYVSDWDKDSAPDTTGSNAGDWDGFNAEICDEAGTKYVYCGVQSLDCALWGKANCGYGCQGESTQPFVTIGLYEDVHNSISDAFHDHDPQCSGSFIFDNDYFQDNNYFRVYEYSQVTKSSDVSCELPQCLSGTCCSGGYFSPSSVQCANFPSTVEYGCLPSQGIRGASVMVRNQIQICSGNSETCNGNLDWSAWGVHKTCTTQQTCIVGNSQCVDVACFDDAECGQTSVQYSCVSDDQHETTTFPVCQDPGTQTAQCTTGTSTNVYDCGEDSDIGSWSLNYCSSGDLVHEKPVFRRGCSGIQCYTTPDTQVETVESCSYGCSTTGGSAHCIVPACVSDSDCNSQDTYVGNKFCQNSDVYQVYHDYSCSYPATESAQCTYVVSTPRVDDCTYGCLMSGGAGVCDLNAPPTIASLSVSPSTQSRVEPVVISCDARDVTDAATTLSVVIEYRSPTSSWVALPVVFSTSDQVHKATFSSQATDLLGNYDVRCQATDPGGKWSGWSEQLAVLNIVDHPTEFTIDVWDHTTQQVPAVAAERINFTTNLYDPDSLVKLFICDAAGWNAGGCANREYCSDGFKVQGAFACSYKSGVDEQSGAHAWTSYALDENGMVTVGKSGDFYIINKPLNPRLTLDGQEIWSYPGYFSNPITVAFNTKLQSILDNCADQTCTIPLVLESQSSGFMDLDNLRILYALYQNFAPQLHHVDNLTVHEGDLVEINPTAFDPNGDQLTFTISNPVGDDGVWQTDEDDDGEYNITVSVSDGRLNDTARMLLRVLELIDPDVGGVITYRNMTITVPPGSLPQNQFTLIEVDEVDETGFIEENGLKLLGRIYRLEPSGMTFDPPLQVEVSYDESQVVDESKLDAFLYKLIDPANQVYRWVTVGAKVDTLNNLVLFNLTHFSEYALHEVDDDDEAPQLSIISPQAKDYFHDSGAITILYALEDERDINPDITLSLDGQVLSGPVIYMGNVSAGEHNLTIVAKDNFANVATKSVLFRVVDFSPPKTSTGSITGWQDKPLTLQLNTTDDSSVNQTYYCVDETDTCLPKEPGEVVELAQEGIFYVRYYSVDVAGNQEARQSVRVALDLSSPVTSHNAPANWSTSDVLVFLNASDAASGVNHTNYRINGGNWSTGNALSMTKEGVHLVEYYSVDQVNHTEAIKNFTLHIDKNPPLSVDDVNSSWFVISQNISLSCSDNLSGCKQTFYCVVRQGHPLCAQTMGNSLKMLCGEGEVCLGTIHYYSMDKAGNNEVKRKSGQMRVDRAQPELRIIEPSPASIYKHTELLSLDILVADNASGLEKFSVFLDGSLVDANTTLNLVTLTLGNHSLSAQAQDKVGNSINTTNQFSIVNNVPTVDNTTPSSPHQINENQTVNFSVKVSDADGENLSFAWYVDGVLQNGSGENYTHFFDFFSNGTREVKVVVKDKYTPIEYAWQVLVGNVNRAPELASLGVVVVSENETLNLALAALDSDGEALSYSTTATFGTLKGNVFTWLPGFNDSGNYQVTFEVRDILGGLDKETIIITVVDNPITNFSLGPVSLDHVCNLESSATLSFSNYGETTPTIIVESSTLQGPLNLSGDLIMVSPQPYVIPLNGGEIRIQLKDSECVPGTYSGTLLARTVNYSTTAPLSVIVRRPQEGVLHPTSLELGLWVRNVTVSLERNLSFTNTGETLQLVSVESDELKLSALNMSLLPGETRQILVSLEDQNQSNPSIRVISEFEGKPVTNTVEVNFDSKHAAQALFVTPKLTLQGRAGEEVRGDIVIRNVGDLPLRGISLTSSADTSYNLRPAQVDLGDLQPQESQTVAYTITMPSSISEESSRAADILFTSSFSTRSIPVMVSKKRELSMSSLEINGKRIQRGGTARLRPGEELKVKAVFENSGLVPIDVEVELEIDDIDEGDDYSKVKELTLRPGSSRRAVFDLDVPVRIEEDDYDALFSLDGVDDQGILHHDAYPFTLRLDKKSVDIDLALQVTHPSQCGDKALVKIVVSNLGSKDLEETTLRLRQEELGVEEKRSFSLEEGSDTTHDFFMSVPIQNETSSLGLDITVLSSRNKIMAEKKAYLTLSACYLGR